MKQTRNLLILQQHDNSDTNCGKQLQTIK